LGTSFPDLTGTRIQILLKNIPMKRWVDENETHEALLFSLIHLCYITGEIVHLVEAGICLIYEISWIIYLTD
jgi:hypothetical protein